MYRRPRRLTQDLVLKGHKDALDELLAELNRQMDVHWQLLDLDNLDATRKAWLQHAVETLTSHQGQAADIAAEFCQDWAKVFTGQGMKVLKPGLQAAKVIRDAEQALDALGPAGIKARIAKGVSPEAASAQALRAVKAAMEKRVLDADRQTVIRSAAADPSAKGWKRITSPGACKFCKMLAGRGEVYDARSVRFAAHDICRCQAVPAWGGEPVNVHQYIASKARITEQERQQLKDYLDTLDDDGQPISTDRTLLTRIPGSPSPEDAVIGRLRAQERRQRGPNESVEERYARQQRLRSDLRDLEPHDGLPLEVLESHEIDFLERFEARGERARWIRRDRGEPGRQARPRNDYVWITQGEQVCELKSTGTKYSSISGRIKSAVESAAAQGVSKDVFVIDLGPHKMHETLARQLSRYNITREKNQIRRLIVMSRDGTEFDEIALAG
ncbi:hypothetical protein [Actinomyces faecalis]|uniref:VG15 protein n=1 Tax=Actinomyces faecalis TaxID=2722820 RepID=UPI0015522DA5|nr:hypothetical protein [Actinomyces faecalis]